MTRHGHEGIDNSIKMGVLYDQDDLWVDARHINEMIGTKLKQILDFSKFCNLGYEKKLLKQLSVLVFITFRTAHVVQIIDTWQLESYYILQEYKLLIYFVIIF